jgi:DNA-binding NarL/FixJ family response regulator
MQPLPFTRHLRTPPTVPGTGTHRVPVPHRPTLKLGVYLVGESPTSNRLLAGMLEDRAAVNVVASSIDEPSAMNWLARQPDSTDLIIVDMFLAAGSGLGVLRRSQLDDPRRRVVVLSNFVHDELRRSCLALGAAQVFDKSTEIEPLLAYCDKLAADLRLQ